MEGHTIPDKKGTCRRGSKSYDPKGSSPETTELMAIDFHVMLLDETPHQRVSLITQRETAELFGWDTAFPEWKPQTHIGPDGREWFYMQRGCGPSGAWRGGKRLRICRDKRKKGYPGGMTHCFRLKGPWTNRHLKSIASVAGEKFEWMENRQLKRVDRDDWLA